jgi:CubicO group peptidase (beta-lactamase class C family)
MGLRAWRTAALAAACVAAACASAGDRPAAPVAPAAQSAEAPPTAAPAGWNAAALAELEAYARSQNTTGFLILHRGRVVSERNWPLPDEASGFRAGWTYGVAADGALLEDVASQQKSLIAVLVGIAADKGMLDVSRPVSDYLGPGWSKAAPAEESAIEVRHLLEMNSGLTEEFAFEAPAGERYFYNTPVYAALKPVLEKASGETLDAITRAWLTEPLGMADTGWRRRPAALARDSGNPTGLVTTPRDLARLGRMVLDGGLAPDGRRVISRAELDAMFERTATNPAYGRLWWLNGGEFSITPNGSRTDGPMIPSAPADLVAAQGAQDRKLYVAPSRALIVVRLGQAAPDRDFNEQLWRRLAAAMPAG